MTKTTGLNDDDLKQFTGTERWYRSGMNGKVLYTEGAKYVADVAGAYWLLDEIALSQCTVRRVSREAFQVWRLSVRPDHSATLTCEDGNYNVIHTRKIGFTDFPLDRITLWFSNNVIYLPSEH